jgi:hypothetical protein
MRNRYALGIAGEDDLDAPDLCDPRNWRAIFGRPARFRDFQRQNVVKPARCQRRMVSG